MDSALKKLGIYDFLGIYFAGALIVAHLISSFPCLIKCITDQFDIIFVTTKNISNNTLKFIFLFVVFGYFIGIVLHEIGRILFDLSAFYCGDTIKQKIENHSCTCQQRYCFSEGIFEKDYTVSVQALKNYVKHRCKCGRGFKLIHFEEALSYIKYKDKRGSRRIDKYHAIYGFSRSMFLYFTVHLFLELCASFEPAKLSWLEYNNVFLVSDLILAVVFLARTKRYYISFVKNVYLQYYI